MDLQQYAASTTLVVKLLSRLSRLPDAVVVNSKAGRRWHEGLGYRPRRWEFVPNGFDTVEFRPDASARTGLRAELGLDSNAILVGLVARYDRMKGHEDFLRAAARLHEEHDKVHFVLAGRGVEAGNTALAAIASALGLDGAVHFLGERADVRRVTAALDIAVSASRFGEGFSKAIGEAMACGVPCVVTDVGDAAVLVGETGRVVPPRQPASPGPGLQ